MLGQHPKPIDPELKKVLDQKSFSGATLAYVFYNANTKKNVMCHQPDVLMAPASVTKLIPTAAALLELSSDFKFKTNYSYNGEIKHDTLFGSLLVKGLGDPTCYSDYFKDQDDFKSVLFAIQNLKIKVITGDIEVDDSAFDSEFANGKWPYEDIGNYYGAGASSISYGDNKYEIVLAKQSDSTTKVLSQNSGLNLTIHNNTISKGNSDNAYVYSMPLNKTSINIYGSIPSAAKKFSIYAAHPHPKIYFQEQLRKYLTTHQIQLLNSANKLTIKAIQFYQHLSPSLKEIIYYTNQESDNHYAETVHKYLGLHLYGKGTNDNALKALTTIYKKYNIDLEHINLYDGCGLSRFNGISCNFITNLLKLMHDKENVTATFFNSFPLSGQQGSMKSFGKGTVLENNMRAKTGYIEKVRAYAGQFKNKSGDTILFSIMINNYTCSASEARKLLEKICLLAYPL